MFPTDLNRSSFFVFGLSPSNIPPSYIGLFFTPCFK